ncbi:acetyltransferase [Theileria orientalis]|uniref:Acetyltransferase n=1 Tax=Theileria orientalis TaxID=68886 RepID=A0A976MFD9_THEOR|nr:acetyltransferase [Theileria orientalis]
MERPDVSYVIRSMTDNDVKSLENLDPDEFTIIYPRAIYLRHVKYFPKLSLVVEINDNVEGFIIGSFAIHQGVIYGHITSLFITEAYRRRGFGSRLMNRFEENSKMLKCKYVNLFVNYRNTSAIQFYKGRNYYIFNKIPRYYSDNEDALEMRKNLE